MFDKNPQPTHLAALIRSTFNLLPLPTTVERKPLSANEHQQLDSTLSHLLAESGQLGPTARLDQCLCPELGPFIQQTAQLLCSPQCRPILRSKLLLAVSNLCFFNIGLRKSAANNTGICRAICGCLELALEEQLGPQNVIDILRLIQMLTYEKSQFTNEWGRQLVPFLTTNILNTSHSDELLPHCMCILCHLVSGSKKFTNQLRQMDFYNQLCARILQLLTHNSKAVVISALVLVGYLDDKTRDTVYSPQNLSQTFLCVFNVLTSTTSASADALMTTHVAVDLLRKLVVVCRTKTPNESPTLNPMAKNLTSYNFFEKSTQKLALLLNILDPRSEQSRKIASLLHTFCQIDELKGPICMALTALEPAEFSGLTTPCNGLLRIAQFTFEEAIFPEVPLTALQLLSIVCREAINAGKSVRRLFSPIKPLFLLIHGILSESNSTTSKTSPFAPFHATRMAEALRLAEAISNDEEVRFELLNEVANAQLCSAIFEHQMATNPITWAVLAQPNNVGNLLEEDEVEASSSTGTTNLPLWSINAVSIPIQMMRLLASLKDHSKPHKELYWRSLKDSRLLPFLAYAIARGDQQQIYDAFILLNHCSQVHEFPLRMLSSLTLKWAAMRKSGGGSPKKLSRKKHENGGPPAVDNSSDFDTSFEQQQRDEQLRVLLAKLGTVEEEKRLLEEENEKERALHAILRGKFDEMTRKFDTAAKAVLEKQAELQKMQENFKSQNVRMEEMEQKVAEYSDKLDQIAHKEKQLEEQTAELVKIQAQNQQLEVLKQAMEQLLLEHQDKTNAK